MSMRSTSTLASAALPVVGLRPKSSLQWPLAVFSSLLPARIEPEGRPHSDAWGRSRIFSHRATAIVVGGEKARVLSQTPAFSPMRQPPVSDGWHTAVWRPGGGGPPDPAL